jgi:glycosyltransferase involved in cell wall biosynthesis
MAGVVERVLADGDLREDMRAKGLERAKLFRWEKTAAETVEAYREAAGK